MLIFNRYSFSWISISLRASRWNQRLRSRDVSDRQFQLWIFSHKFVCFVCLQTVEIQHRIQMSESLNTRDQHDYHDSNAPPSPEEDNLTSHIELFSCYLVHELTIQNLRFLLLPWKKKRKNVTKNEFWKYYYIAIKQILRFDVSVDDMLAVEIFQCTCYLTDVLRCCLLIEPFQRLSQIEITKYHEIPPFIVMKIQSTLIPLSKQHFLPLI